MNQDPIGISIASLVVSGFSAFIALISVVVSVLSAKRYGDVAGSIKQIQYDQAKSTQATIAGLRSLINEVARIKKLVDHNSQTEPMLVLPTAAFEAAFLSGQSSLIPPDRLLDAVTTYLMQADLISELIQMNASPRPGSTSLMNAASISVRIKRLCTDTVPPTLTTLKEQLDIMLRDASGRDKHRS